MCVCVSFLINRNVNRPVLTRETLLSHDHVASGRRLSIVDE